MPGAPARRGARICPCESSFWIEVYQMLWGERGEGWRGIGGRACRRRGEKELWLALLALSFRLDGVANSFPPASRPSENEHAIV